jgi:hypothetical protein
LAEGIDGGPAKAGIMPNKAQWHKEKSRDDGRKKPPRSDLKSS